MLAGHPPGREIDLQSAQVQRRKRRLGRQRRASQGRPDARHHRQLRPWPRSYMRLLVDQWKSEGKSSAQAGPAVYPKAAVVGFDDLARNGKAHAHAGQMAAPLLAAIIALENVLLLVRANP